MEVYLEDLQEAEANVVRKNNAFLRERGWKEEHRTHKNYLLWSKTFKRSEMGNWPKTEPDGTTTVAELLTTAEAIDVEKGYGSRNLHRTADG